MGKPKLSIIVPVYNVELYIEKCIKSILNQTFMDYEVVIVNDCTPDESMRIINSIVANDARFKIINHAENRGAMCSRESGYKNAVGDYYCFVDSDDYIPNNAIELLYNKIVEENADIVVGKIESIYSTKSVCNCVYKVDEYIGSEKIIQETLRGNISSSLYAKIYKKSLFDSVQPAITGISMSEDTMLTFQLLDNVNRLVFIEELVYFYYQNELSTTHTLKLSNIIQKINTTRFMYNKFKNNLNLKKEINGFVIRSYGRAIVDGFKGEDIIGYYDFVNLAKLMRYFSVVSYISDIKVIASIFLFHFRGFEFFFNKDRNI